MAERRLLWRANPRQMVAMRSPIADLLYGGARGGGKSDYLIMDYWNMNRQVGPVRGILVRRTIPELDEIIARCHALYPSLGGEWKAADKTWEFPNGGALKLRYLETVADASRYQGHGYQWVGVDEAGNYLTSAVVDLMRGTLRTTIPGQPCRLRLTANPGGPGHDWLKKRYVDPGLPEKPHLDPETGAPRVYVPARLDDNPHIQDKEAYRANLKQAGPPHLVRAWLHGDWNVRSSGGILRPEKIGRGEPPPRARMRTYLAIDPAASRKDQTGGDPDYTALAIIGVDDQRRFWLLHLERGRLTGPEVCRAIKRLWDAWGPDVCWMEGGPIGNTMKGWLDEYQEREGTHWPIILTSTAGDKVTKATALAWIIDSGLMWAAPGVSWWQEWEDEATTFDGSDDHHDDQVDAVAIGCREIRRMAEGAAPPKAESPVPSRAGRSFLDSLDPPKEAEGRGRLGSWSSFRK